MSDHFIRPDNDPEPTAAEINALADEYQRGLDKMVASGYEEYGYQIQRQHALVIAALRAYADIPAEPQAVEVTDASYCPFCDLEHELHEDAQGFHHVIKGERIACSVTRPHQPPTSNPGEVK